MTQQRPLPELSEETQEKLRRFSDALEAGLFSEVDELFPELWEQLAESAIANLNDDPDSQEFMLAVFYEQDGQWDEARRIYQQRLARVDRTDHLELASRNSDLANHHFALDELNLAAMYSAEATQASRLLGMDDVILPARLLRDARIAKQQQRFAAACENCDEALSLLPDSRAHDLLRSIFFVERAECQFRLRRLDSAVRDHDQAWELLSPQSVMESMSGVQLALGEWWTLAADLWEFDGDLEQAVHGWQQAGGHLRRSIELCDEGSPTTLLPLARWLIRYGDFLGRMGQSEDADACYAESDQIRRRFKLPPLPRTSVPGSSLGRN